QIIGKMVALPGAGRPAEHRLAAHAHDAGNARASCRLMHVEGAHDVDAKRLIVRHEAMGANAGKMKNRVHASSRVRHLLQILDVADALAIDGLGACLKVKRCDMVLVRLELADDPLPKLSRTPGNEDLHARSAAVVRFAHVNSRSAGSSAAGLVVVAASAPFAGAASPMPIPRALSSHQRRQATIAMSGRNRRSGGQSITSPMKPSSQRLSMMRRHSRRE